MLRRLVLRDVAIVAELEIELQPGFNVLTGETGAGKSILVDALQLVLGGRADAGVVREGASRADLSAEFDTPAGLVAWLIDAGFDAGGVDGDGALLLRRTIDVAGKSRAWINGSSATAAQLREAAVHLVEIHGQHAWQQLTQPAAVRALLDAQAHADPRPVAVAWSAWRQAVTALAEAGERGVDRTEARDRLVWQIGEVAQLAPETDGWDALDAEHRRLSNAQALIDAGRLALDAVADADDSAVELTGRSLAALQSVAAHDPALAEVLEVLRGAEAQLQDAAHSLSSYLAHTEPEPARLSALDERMAAWVGLARRYRRPPAELPALLAQWTAELAAIESADDVEALTAVVAARRSAYDEAAAVLSAARQRAAPLLASAVSAAMQQLGMAGGRLEVALLPQAEPQPYGLETVELLVAGHVGSTPRALAKVASGGELSRIALAIAATTGRAADATAVGTLIFDEIDAGVGGTVGLSVGQMMQSLAGTRQVLAVTHLPQVAGHADHHWIVSKHERAGKTLSEVRPVDGEERVAEMARMLGGERLADTGRAHARQMLLASSRRGPAAAAPAPMRRTA